MTRRFHIAADFPEVLVKHKHQTIEVTCGGFSTAVARGLREIMKRPGIKRKRLTKIHLAVVISHTPTEETTTPPRSIHS